MMERSDEQSAEIRQLQLDLRAIGKQVDEVLASMQFPPDTRAEELDVGQLVELSNRLQRRMGEKTLE